MLDGAGTGHFHRPGDTKPKSDASVWPTNQQPWRHLEVSRNAAAWAAAHHHVICVHLTV